MRTINVEREKQEKRIAPKRKGYAALMDVNMPNDSEGRVVSKGPFGRPNVRFPIFMVLFVFFGAATSTVLFAQDTARTELIPRQSLGVLVDTSAHQKKVLDFEREVVNAVAEGFAGVATESFVVRYGNEVEILQDWSPLDPGLRNVSARIGLDVDAGKNQRTLLNEALNLGLRKLDARNISNSKILIVIGEGNNAGGGIKYSEIKKRAISSRVQCFVLLVADHNLMGGRVRHFGFDLYDLASATKGKAYDVERSQKNLDKAVRDILKRIQSHRE